MIKYVVENGRDLYAYLKDRDLLEFGSVFLGDDVREVLDIRYPNVGHRSDFTSVALFELSAIDYVRNRIMADGKYLACVKGNYRILLPSENADQCDRYISSAVKKLNRSIKLSRNTPVGDHPSLDNKTVRALMQKESVRKQL